MGELLEKFDIKCIDFKTVNQTLMTLAKEMYKLKILVLIEGRILFKLILNWQFKKSVV